MTTPVRVLTHLKTDSRCAKLLSGKFEYTRGMKNVDPSIAVRLKAKVLHAVKELKDNGYVVGPRAYGQAITVVGRVGMSQTAEDLWEETAEMRRRRMPMIVCLYNAILHARLRKVKELEEARHIINSLFNEMTKARVYRDRYTYNVALKGLAYTGGYEQCTGLLKTMAGNRVQPDGVTFNTLLTSARSSGDIGTVLSMMKENRISPGEMSYLAVVSAYAKIGDIKKAEMWVEKSVAEGVRDERQINIVVGALEREGDCEGLRRFLNRSETEFGITPSIEAYHLAMLAFIKTDLQQVAKYYRTLQSHHAPSSRTYTIFIHALHHSMKQRHPTDPMIPKMVKAARLAFATSLRDNLPSSKLYHAMARVYHQASEQRLLEDLYKNYIACNKFYPSPELDELLRTCQPDASAEVQNGQT
eukprot:TRINITY_DN23791_c1_g1_i1.p1 TRINITY_DN23791_c1_g1~~TRINITY_DN23791_c1_g1_i1.p1  ORF type:complete len:415 (+),score=70.76 TRINITY_DN23791_c1_g1_i1:53-1297(+)